MRRRSLILAGLMLIGIFTFSPLLLADHHHDDCQHVASCALCHFISACADQSGRPAELNVALLLTPAPYPADHHPATSCDMNTHSQRAPPLSS